MGKEIIENYIERVLNNRLKSFNLEEKYIKIIKENIKKQMYSLIFHWRNEEFRKGILLIGEEEGKFYEPETSLEVKEFIVVTLRNSYLECIFSVDYRSMGLKKKLDESLVKVVTSEAIEYFKNVNFLNISEEINGLEIDDVYGNIIKEYPLAWNALINLGKCISNRIVFKEKVKERKIKTEELNKLYKEEKSLGFFKDEQSGISEEFSQNLIKIINGVIEKENRVLYVDCFKMLTRNFDKLLNIIEILLENKDYLLTSNYLITNTYIGKRKNILRAAHTQKEVEEKIKNDEFYLGLSKTHRDILEKLFK